MLIHPSTDIIANGLAIFAQEQKEANLVKLLRALSIVLQEHGEVLLPVAENEAANGQIMLQTQIAEDGLTYVTAFSSNKAMQDNPVPVLSRPLANYFEAILLMEGIEGIIFNPTSPAPCKIQKPMLKALLEEAQKSAAKSSISVWRGDITTLDCDAIVNAANSTLLGGGGVDGAIHQAAGPQLLQECKSLGGCATGQAKITFAYELPASYVIHTVGPIYNGETAQRLELADCYRNSLEVAFTHHVHSIAFPAISTGAYGYPLEEAARIALLTTTQWLKAHAAYPLQVIFTCYNSPVQKVYESLLKQAQNGTLE